jgi:hypothetical protein
MAACMPWLDFIVFCLLSVSLVILYRRYKINGGLDALAGSDLILLSASLVILYRCYIIACIHVTKLILNFLWERSPKSIPIRAYWN